MRKAAFADRMLKVGELVLKSPQHPKRGGDHEKRAYSERDAERMIAERKAIRGVTKKESKKRPGSEARKAPAITVHFFRNGTGAPLNPSKPSGVLRPSRRRRSARRCEALLPG